MSRILYDAFFHHLPGHRLGEQITVGGYAVNFGRYAPGDGFHPNGLAYLQADLARDGYDLRLLTAPYSDAALFDADILLITNPDYPLYAQASPYRWTPKDVDALLRFLERGGGVLLLVNSFLSRPDYWEENFDYERVSLLFDRLGLRWDPNYMSDDNIIEPAQAGPYRIGYGQGGRVLGALPAGVEPLITYQGNIYGFRTRVGQGQLVVIGDTGMISNGLMSFPGFDNAKFFAEIFRQLAPAWGERWDRLSYGHLSCAPSKTGLSEEILRALRPQAAWMDDHHYRHLTWNETVQTGAGAEVWQALPVDPAALAAQTSATAALRWASLDGRAEAPAFDMPLAVTATRHGDTTDLHIIGRTQSTSLTWADLCADPALFAPAGQVEVIHAAFELHAVLDAAGAPRRARWSQGQLLFARNPNSLHYGYEVLLNSDNGIILPRA